MQRHKRYISSKIINWPAHRRGERVGRLNNIMEKFKDLIASEKPVLVDFFATWCGPCQMMHPAIDKFQREMNGRVDVYKVDIDDRGMLDAVHRYNIMSVPTLMFFRRGEVLWRESGLASYDHLVNVLRELEKREQVAQR